MLIDTHCHLDNEAYDSDREEVISGFSGIIINCGTNLTSSIASKCLAQKHSHIYAACGLHPNDATEANQDFYQALKYLVKEDKVVAVGECGLDFFRKLSPIKLQEEVFYRLIQIAKEASLPLIVHCREAMRKTLDILKETKVEKAVLHAFSGTEEEAAEAIDLGFYISISGVITFKNSHLKDLVKTVPNARLLFETDCPYLTPHPYRGKRNLPEYVQYVADACADSINLSLNEAINMNYQNACRLFGIK